jgi:hypothetical protein
MWPRREKVTATVLVNLSVSHSHRLSDTSHPPSHALTDGERAIARAFAYHVGFGFARRITFASYNPPEKQQCRFW